MKVEIHNHLDKKGLGTSDLFQAIPVGRKGTDFEVSLYGGGKIKFQFNSNVRDAEIKVAVALLSHSFSQMGKTALDKIRGGIRLPEFNEETGQPEYMRGLSVDAKELAEIIYPNDENARKKARRVYKHLANLENLTIHYDIPGIKTTLRLIARPALKNGIISFDISNTLINRLGTTLLSFRLPPVLAHDGLTMRLAMWIETHQRPGKKYKKEGELHTKYYPKNEYYLDELRGGLRLEGRREDKVIFDLQEAFRELNLKDDSNFPKFTHNKYRKSFESEYKNSRTKVPTLDKKVPSTDKKVPTLDIFPSQSPSTA